MNKIIKKGQGSEIFLLERLQSLPLSLSLSLSLPLSQYYYSGISYSFFILTHSIDQLLVSLHDVTTKLDSPIQ